MQFVARHSPRRLVLIGWMALALAAASVVGLASAGSASAHSCGFNSDEVYNHCGNTHVLVTARNFWGTQYTVCVGPGEHDLGYLSYWRIVNAWYIGWLC